MTPPVATLTAPISFFAANRTLDLDPIDVTGASSDIHQVVNVNVPSGGSVAVPKVTVVVEIDKD